MPTQMELLDELTAMAAAWSDNPHLQGEMTEGQRCRELREALADRFGLHVDIKREPEIGPTEFRVRAVQP